MSRHKWVTFSVLIGNDFEIYLRFKNIIFNLLSMSRHNGVIFSVLIETNFEIYVFKIKQKLDNLFIITESKLPKFEFLRTFSLVVAIVNK